MSDYDYTQLDSVSGADPPLDFTLAENPPDSVVGIDFSANTPTRILSLEAGQDVDTSTSVSLQSRPEGIVRDFTLSDADDQPIKNIDFSIAELPMRMPVVAGQDCDRSNDDLRYIIGLITTVIGQDRDGRRVLTFEGVLDLAVVSGDRDGAGSLSVNRTLFGVDVDAGGTLTLLPFATGVDIDAGGRLPTPIIPTVVEGGDRDRGVSTLAATPRAVRIETQGVDVDTGAGFHLRIPLSPRDGVDVDDGLQLSLSKFLIVGQDRDTGTSVVVTAIRYGRDSDGGGIVPVNRIRAGQDFDHGASTRVGVSITVRAGLDADMTAQFDDTLLDRIMTTVVGQDPDGTGRLLIPAVTGVPITVNGVDYVVNVVVVDDNEYTLSEVTARHR